MEELWNVNPRAHFSGGFPNGDAAEDGHVSVTLFPSRTGGALAARATDSPSERWR
jgi:hypothetical protein